MAILNRIIDSIVGVPSMRKTRNLRMEAMRNIYDPTVYNEIATRQRTRATEGLSDLAEQTALRRVASQAAAPIDPSILGGDAARAMAMSTSQQAAVNRTYGDVAARLAEMDEQIRAQYGDAYAQTVATQSQQLGFRRAAIAGEQATFEQERSMRRRQLGAQALSAGISIGGALLGVPGASSIGGLVGGAITQRKESKNLTADVMAMEAERMKDIPTRENMPTVPFKEASPIVFGPLFPQTQTNYPAMREEMFSRLTPADDTVTPQFVANPQMTAQGSYVPPLLRRDNLDWLYKPIKGAGGPVRRNPMDQDYFLSGYGFNR